MNDEEYQSVPAKEGWLDNPKNVQRVLRWLFISCAFLVLVDCVYPLINHDKHPYFKWEKWPGFYAVFGFVSSAVLVFIAKHVLRPLVMRSEHYYDEKGDKKGGEDA